MSESTLDTPTTFDPRAFRDVMGHYPTGVVVVTAVVDDEPVGMVVGTFSSVSLEPPLVLWTLSRSASSLPHFERCERYVVHVLAATQLELAKRFAYGPQSSRFHGLSLKRSPAGALMLDEAECAAWFQCYNLTRHVAGDHLIFIGQVERCHRNFSQPLVYHAGDFDLTPSTEPLSSN